MRLPSLPPEAQDILTRIEVEDRQISDAARHRAAELQQLANEESDAVAEVQRLADADKAGKLNREERGEWNDDAGEQAVQKVRDPSRLTAANADLASIRRKKLLLGSSVQIERLTGARIKHELAKYNCKLIAVQRPQVPLAKGERATDALSRAREASLALIAERKALAKAPRTNGEVKAAAYVEIDKLADSGLPKTLAMFHGAGIAWPRHTITEGRYHVPDGVALVAFLMRDQLKTQLSKLIEFNASAFPDAMSAEEKTERLAELDLETEAAERLEAAAVEQVISEGGVAYHRPNCSILAALSLRIA
ncbi:hypothetical protein G6321_00002675 (plasmid) [Bradyrhizobium barranii subsp. barranii]|uniref:Uncharacterized protein n=1 Tax=Bradyrhizobium barranii subsp. barranii TaxID=2823807 RepID=A0A7Z0QM12_9BRAD|nr:hypothetical protein [Bradyrhizobium barranii]UGX89853.1 hypothetical protein G6321_00002675 [Bradyrhizobium barranii subsp. barranii]